jgi:hypothetical protein
MRGPDLAAHAPRHRADCPRYTPIGAGAQGDRRTMALARALPRVSGHTSGSPGSSGGAGRVSSSGMTCGGRLRVVVAKRRRACGPRLGDFPWGNPPAARCAASSAPGTRSARAPSTSCRWPTGGGAAAPPGRRLRCGAARRSPEASARSDAFEPVPLAGRHRPVAHQRLGRAWARARPVARGVRRENIRRR